MKEQPIADFQKIRLAADKGKGGEALPAAHGNFSEHFYRVVTAALRKAPGVVEHVVSMVSASGAPEDRVDGTREAPLPMSAQAFDDANEIYSLLVYWSRVFASELHVQAPGPAVRAWRNQAGTIVGLPNNVTAQDARYMVGIMTTWLNINIDAILALDPDDVLAFAYGNSDNDPELMKMDGGLKTIFHIDARWPQEEKPRYSDMPCVKDDCRGKVAVFPPAKAGDDERIVCETCGLHYMPDQYERLVGVFKQIRAEQNTATIAARHLLAKYREPA